MSELTIANALGLGVEAHKAGKFHEADRYYTAILDTQPEHPDANHNMGVLAASLGKHEQALPFFVKALEANLFVEQFWLSYVDALMQLQRLDDVKIAIQKAKANNLPAALIKRLEDTLSNHKSNANHSFYQNELAQLSTLYKQGHLEAVIDKAQQLTKKYPNDFVIWNNLGIASKGFGRLNLAAYAFKKVLSLKPDYAEAHNNMGTVLQDQGNLEGAIEIYKEALSLKPNYADACYNMGIAYEGIGKLKESIKAYKKALSIKPDHPEAFNNMGNSYNIQGEYGAAIKAYKKAISLQPYYAEAHHNMGSALTNQGKSEQAIAAYKKALLLKPDFTEAHLDMGNAQLTLGNFEEAVKSYRQALSIKPDYAEVHYNSSFIYNLKGDLETGLMLFEWRKNIHNPLARASRDGLSWDRTKSLQGKKILVYEEQGLGDIFQFCRYLILLEQKGADVTFQVRSSLHTLVKTMGGNVKLTANLPEENLIDYEAALMSLPHLLNTRLETIPAYPPYLFADPENVAKWKARLSKDSFKIGICWQGSKTKVDIGRSFPLPLFAGIANLANVELISLHKGEGESQVNDIDFGLTVLGDDFDAGEDAFQDSAAVIMNCDLIITSDTAIAHLAGALGCPTWVVLKHIPDWRWMLDRSDSPWYPSMVLYRQDKPGDWATVFYKMQQDLILLLEKKGK